MMTSLGLFTWQYCQILWLKPSHLNSGFADYQYETPRETQAIFSADKSSYCAQAASYQLAFVRESRIQTIPPFQLKYLCSWSHDNTLALTDGASKSSKDYYNDNSIWSSKGSYKAAITLGKTGVPGRECVYTYVVIIGTPSTKAQAAKPASIQGPISSEAPTSLALEGDVAPVPGLGDTIHLPGGPTTVIRHW
ncbi:hypothetical protein BDV39DRAFT_191203 [Aspergillus sergii]|uniref:Uncharacterized protein n=1 Tax=Aspergillus sergii TaxID=1034303 RepID=A0A5N6XDG6_9EURO|nr:hypothetical protein BDV39DRAFT_191203 [Aspergillus sergii]